MHAKTDSDGTSADASWLPWSLSRRPIYYVQSPSNHDLNCLPSPTKSLTLHSCQTFSQPLRPRATTSTTNLLLLISRSLHGELETTPTPSSSSSPKNRWQSHWLQTTPTPFSLPHIKPPQPT